MSKSSLTITRYNITKCGYFKPHARKASKHFGDIAASLKSLMSWSTGKTLLETKVSEGNASGLPAYLMDIVTSKNEYLICLWNEIHSTEGNILSVPLNDPVGTTNVSTSKLPDGNIAGYPAYFWFKPELNEFRTVQFPGELNGRNNLQVYLENFLAKYNSNHVVADENAADEAEFHKAIKGYRKDASSEVIDSDEVRTCFESLLMRDENQKSELKSLVKDVYGLIRKEAVTGNATVQTSFLGMLIKGVGINTLTSNTADMEYRLKYEIGFKPSQEEFDQIIDNWGGNEENNWENIGFKISGKSSPVWIDATIARSKFDIEVVKQNNSVDSLELLKELQKIRF